MTNARGDFVLRRQEWREMAVSLRCLAKCGFLVVLILLLGCGEQLPPEDEAFKQAILSKLAAAESVEVWEGLPHPSMDAESFQGERARMKTIDLHGHAFYDDARELTAEQREKFVDLLSKSNSLSPVHPKTCGGFHPDLALRWKVGDDEYSILFCYGCCEIEFRSPSQVTKFNMNCKLPFEELRQPFQKHRPQRKPRS